MPQEQENFQKAVDEILRVIIFENWLRFYFIVEGKDGEIKLELPEKTLAKIAGLYPGYLPLAESLNGKTLDFETSRQAILMHVLDHLDGQKLPRGLADTVLSSSTFQTKLQLFNAWVQMHEDQLDQGFLDFGMWLGLFEDWAAGPGALDLARVLNKDK